MLTVPRYIFLLFLFLGGSVLSSCIEKQNDHVIIMDMNYHDARKIILQSGWKSAEDMPPYEEIGALAHHFRDLGYAEVEECSGGSTTLCNFYFQNEKGEYLRIGTEGEDNNVRIYPRVIYAAIRMEID